MAEHLARHRREDRRRAFRSPRHRLRLVEEGQDRQPRRVRGHEADERQHAGLAGIDARDRIELLGGPRLARHLVPLDLGPVAGPEGDDAGQDVGQGRGRLRRDHLANGFGLEPPDLPAGPV